MVWQYFPTIAILILFLLLVITLWKLIGKITPTIEYEEVPVNVPFIPPTIPAEPVSQVEEAKREAKRAAYKLAMRYVEDSARQNGGKSNKLLSATEWEALGANRESHTAALDYLKGQSLIKTKQGGKPEEQGTFVQEDGKDLIHLLRTVTTTPPP